MMCLITIMRWTAAAHDQPNMSTETVGIECLLLHAITYPVHPQITLLHTATCDWYVCYNIIILRHFLR